MPNERGSAVTRMLPPVRLNDHSRVVFGSSDTLFKSIALLKHQFLIRNDLFVQFELGLDLRAELGWRVRDDD
jgi:hypothetical protein